MGGDKAPEEVVAGALEAASPEIQPILFGPAGLDTGGLELVETTQVIGMEEKPAEAVRAKPDSSLVAACRAVGEGKAEAVLSAGNTGAMLAASFLELRRLPGVARPAIAVVIPTKSGPSVLLDSGANADARPEHLHQFAHMGAVFAEDVLEVRDPEVRLLSIGEEPEKGNQLTLEAHALLAPTRPALRRQHGEPRPSGRRRRRRRLRRVHRQRRPEGDGGNDPDRARGAASRDRLEPPRQVGGLLVRPAARGLRQRLDPETYGGAYLLGLRGLAVIAHGNSSRRAIANAIRLAAKGVEHDVVGRLGQRLPEECVASARSEPHRQVR